MYTYVFIGIIYPETVSFTLDGVPQGTMQFLDFGIEGKINIKAFKSRLTLTFTTSSNLLKFDSSLMSLRNFCSEYARLWIDTYCYIKSYNYDLFLERVECPELNILVQFNVQLEINPQVSPMTMQDVIPLLTQNPALVFIKDVFADFRRGLKYPHMTGFFFYRSLETIKLNYFNNSWNKMNMALGTSENDYIELNKYRNPNAHGAYPPITHEQRLSLAEQTRFIIDQFISHIKKDI